MTESAAASKCSMEHRAKERTGRSELSLLSELIDILRPHEKGLRRWSVMRAMRETHKRQSREITPKFEHDIERVFRRYCVGDSSPLACAREAAPFFRPRDTAGEVWALHPQRADAILLVMS